MAMADRHEWILDKAYGLWVEAGRPDGQDQDHWRQASDAWEAEHQDLVSDGAAQPAQAGWDDESEE
jgi:hypothetical protein